MHARASVERVSPVLRLQSRAFSFACLGRFARRIKKKERLLVVYEMYRDQSAEFVFGY